MVEETFSPNASYGYPSQQELYQIRAAMASIGSLIKEAQNLPNKIRRKMRGEALRQYPDGEVEYVQVSKPLFVKFDSTYTKPIKQKIKYKDGTIKEIFLPNDDAIEEIMSLLESMGLNDVTLISNISEEIILDDLLEFECKLAMVLGLKQKSWGIDKQLLPLVQSKIKTLVQDARFMARAGTTIKAIQKTVSRTEILNEGEKKEKRNPYG